MGLSDSDHFSCSEWKWRWEVKETKSCHLSATVMSLDRSIKMFAFHQIERRLCNCSLLTELQRWWWFPFLTRGPSENHPEKCNTLFPKCITAGKVQCLQANIPVWKSSAFTYQMYQMNHIYHMHQIWWGLRACFPRACQNCTDWQWWYVKHKDSSFCRRISTFLWSLLQTQRR